ncbi:MAG: undecaprenyl-diphosphate phosphatase [Acidimicrobiales bacterium]
MPVLHAVVLGVVQGLTEFLPVSSSGHLVLTRWLFGWSGPSAALEKALDVGLHVGTMIGAVGYLRHDLASLVRDAVRAARARSIGSSRERLPWLLAVSALPAAATGGLLESTIVSRLGEPWLIAVALVVFALVLAAADRCAQVRDVGAFGGRQAWLMGGAQALALQPGVSRSGVTMSVARLLRFDRESAVRLSFLMSLPLIGGAAAYEGVQLIGGGAQPPGYLAAVAWGMAASAVTAWAAVWAVLRLVRTRSFMPFVVYRVLAGLAVITIIATGLR